MRARTGNDPILTVHPRIMKANEAFLPWNLLRGPLDALAATVAVQDAQATRALLMELVPEYAATADLSDWVAKAQPEQPKAAKPVKPANRTAARRQRAPAPARVKADAER